MKKTLYTVHFYTFAAQSLFWTAFLFVFSGCKSPSVEFAVYCSFPEHVLDARTLVLTNAAGNVVQHYEIKGGITELSEKFEYTPDDPEERLDYHLITDGSNGFECTQIFSHLSVPNGAPVAFDPQPNSDTTGVNFPYFDVQINGIQSFYELQVPGILFVNPYDASKKQVSLGFGFSYRQNYVARLKANGSPLFRYLYLPDTSNVSLEYQWADLKPENHPTEFTFPDIASIRILWLEATTDKDRTYTVLYARSAFDPVLSAPPQFNIPDELFGQAEIRVWMTTPNLIIDQLFAPDAPLEIGPLNMQIKSASAVPGQSLSVDAEGDIDLLRVVTRAKSSLTGCTLRWQIDGQPATFVQYRLPDLHDFLPAAPGYVPFFEHFTVSAHQLGQHDYVELRRGVPFRYNSCKERMTLARSGYRALTQDY